MARAAAEAATEGSATWVSTAAGTRSSVSARGAISTSPASATSSTCALPPVDLLVCSDVMHYLDTRELDRGLPALAELCHGVAFLETFTREDGIDGDNHGFKRRPAKFYRNGWKQWGCRRWARTCGSPLPCTTIPPPWNAGLNRSA